MTQEDKKLLLIDLCGRSPYGVIINVNGNDERVDEVNPFEGIITCGFQSFDVDECKPYLRPMSSMTEEEEIEYDTIFAKPWYNSFYIDSLLNGFDWLNAHHFDYRGLIEKGLAIAITEENNPYK